MPKPPSLDRPRGARKFILAAATVVGIALEACSPDASSRITCAHPIEVATDEATQNGVRGMIVGFFREKPVVLHFKNGEVEEWRNPFAIQAQGDVYQTLTVHLEHEIDDTDNKIIIGNNASEISIPFNGTNILDLSLGPCGVSR
jgi:hypothetical protein